MIHKDLGKGLIALSLSLLMGSAVFAEETPQKVVKSRVSPLAKGTDYDSKVQEETPKESKGSPKKGRKRPPAAITPTARGCPGRNNIYATGDYILWKAVEDAILLVAEGQAPVGSPQGILGNTHLSGPGFRYRSGFQIGVGLNVHYDNWDFYGNWTHMRNSTTTSESASAPVFFIMPVQSGSVGGDPPTASSYTVDWKLRFDTFDVEMGRQLYLGRRLIIRPFASARAAWINRRMEANFTGMNSNYANFFQGVSPRTLNGPMFLDFKNTFWGLGPRAGVDTRWMLTKLGFGFLANISGSLLTGPFRNRTTAIVNDVTVMEGALLDKRLFTTRTNVEGSIGFDYGHCFARWVFLYTSVSYEVSYWWNMLATLSYIDTSVHKNDLCLRGLNVQLRVDF